MKKRILFTGITTSLFFQAQAANISKNKDEFCNDRKDQFYIQNLLNDNSDSRMSFRNQGGIFNGGVCWWHSRFQRNAAYLTAYNPNNTRPDEEQTKAIIKAIRKAKSPIQINGYRNFKEFSRTNAKLILRELEKWQKSDGFLKQQWILGLKGKTEVSAEKLEKMMHELYDDVSSGDIAYQVLQIKGVTAHAWLVTEVTKTSNGYTFKVLDSNYPTELKTYNYKFGQTSFYHSYYGKFVAYTYKDREEERIQKRVEKFCHE